MVAPATFPDVPETRYGVGYERQKYVEVGFLERFKCCGLRVPFWLLERLALCSHTLFLDEYIPLPGVRWDISVLRAQGQCVCPVDHCEPRTGVLFDTWIGSAGRCCDVCGIVIESFLPKTC